LVEEEVYWCPYVFDRILPVAESLYVRAELRSMEGLMLALTNPLYLVREQT
jgi:hypothetical protein